MSIRAKTQQMPNKNTVRALWEKFIRGTCRRISFLTFRLLSPRRGASQIIGVERNDKRAQRGEKYIFRWNDFPRTVLQNKLKIAARVSKRHAGRYFPERKTNEEIRGRFDDDFESLPNWIFPYELLQKLRKDRKRSIVWRTYVILCSRVIWGEEIAIIKVIINDSSSLFHASGFPFEVFHSLRNKYGTTI